LTAITIPKTVKTIGYSAFNGCSSLATVTFETPSILTSIGGSAFFGCEALTSMTIPETVNIIGHSAFSGCTLLNSINIPSIVTNIYFGTFQDCKALTSITLPNGLNSIASYAFSGCAGLTSINIPRTVRTIGSFAFSGCEELISIAIPINVTSIGAMVFYECKNLSIQAEAPNRPSGWDPKWNILSIGDVIEYVEVEWNVSDCDKTEVIYASALIGNYPNPFNPETTIRFAVGDDGDMNVSIDIYNVRGQRVRTLVNGEYSSGHHVVVWNGTDDHGRNVASGVYLYRMNVGEYSSVRRMLLLK
jgi:hypothetical protein